MGIDDVRDSVPPVPAGVTPDDHPEQEARISDVPFVGDGFHTGGCRLYDQHPEIVAARSRAYKKMQEQPDVFSRFFGWIMDKVFLAERTSIPKLLVRIIKKISGNDRQPPAASSGDGSSSAPNIGVRSPDPDPPNASSRQMVDPSLFGGGYPVTSCSILSFFNPAFAFQSAGLKFMSPVFLAPIKVF